MSPLACTRLGGQGAARPPPGSSRPEVGCSACKTGGSRPRTCSRCRQGAGEPFRDGGRGRRVGHRGVSLAHLLRGWGTWRSIVTSRMISSRENRREVLRRLPRRRIPAAAPIEQQVGTMLYAPALRYRLLIPVGTLGSWHNPPVLAVSPPRPALDLQLSESREPAQKTGPSRRDRGRRRQGH